MTPPINLGQLAKFLHAELHGNSNHIIETIAPLYRATNKQLAFIENPKRLPALKTTQAGAVLLTKQLAGHCSTNALIVPRPKLALAKIFHFLYPPQSAATGIHPSVQIGDNCSISPDVSIGPNVVIGRQVKIGRQTIIGANTVIGDQVQIGADSVIHANVSLYHEVQIGNEVIIHSGAVIGADGFGFEQDEDKTWIKIKHIGSVQIGNGVEIGANTTIDRGALDDTWIGDGVKLDNLIMIAHNVIIGENTVIAGCTGIAGSAKIGKNCIIGGACSINGHVELADNVIVSGMAMVTKSLNSPGVYSSGTGILPRKQWQKVAIRFKQLDEIYQRLKTLEQAYD